MDFEDQPFNPLPPPPTPPPTTNPNTAKGNYKECLKNHAVGIGGHALDGCGEFMAAGAEGTLDALKCAACNCHRNFHRKDPAESSFQLRRHRAPQFAAAFYRAPAGYLQVAGPQRGGLATLALPSTSGAGGGAQSPGEEQENVSEPSGGGGGCGSHKKRFRTKFSLEQKDKMLAFAEKLGWRIQKHDESLVQEFCSQTGLQRHVLKVWMHNNKHTLGKKP
ncbi:hypothetical protein PHAVU_003G289700 [Phaseolus vulgaris]|uniref:ZF-HD dimerization-type domain-containing protein n=1 Tax=Phaseolus vulgaris TaxID=3885 RepID=V7CE50_PHAVU|nr:hypothetical protein PHAVU_003G289700g [Phaseolus vulgaris]ESW28477.1 hypothetical protein PHAVU_003G289700g [Phaseolus vulgaris]